MNSEDLALKEMFDITEQLVNDQEEIHGLDNSLGKEFMETTFTEYQSSTHISLCLLGFCVVPREDPSTSRFQRSLEKQKGPIREKLQRLWWYRWRADRIKSGTSSQDSQRCSSSVKSMSYWATWERPEISTWRILFMSMFNDISCDRKGNEG